MSCFQKKNHTEICSSNYLSVRVYFLFVIFFQLFNSLGAVSFPFPSAVKIYNGHSISRVYQTAGDKTNYRFVSPSLGLQWNLKKGLFTEVEFNSFSLQNRNMPVFSCGTAAQNERSHVRLTDMNFGSRLEIGRLVSSYHQSKWLFYYSGALLMNKTRKENMDAVAGLQLLSQRVADVHLQFIPRLSYKAGKRVSIEANFPLSLFSANSSVTHKEPQGGEMGFSSGRKTRTEILPATFSMRLGLSVHL